MKKLLILGSFKATWQVIDYARRHGIYTIVTDKYSPEISKAKGWADEYWMIDTSYLEQLEKRCRADCVNGVMCGLTEYNIGIMIELCERLSLPCYLTKEQWHYSKDKADFKLACKKVGLPVAKDYSVPNDYTEADLDLIEFPVVVKPVDRAGNYGISFCYSKHDFSEAYIKAKEATFSKDKIIIEKMLKGQEYYAMYAVKNGEITLLGLCSMYYEDGTPTNCYYLTTTAGEGHAHYLREGIDEKVKMLINEIGITDGLFWIQFMTDDDGKLYAIEMGQRIDGEMMYIPFQSMTGYDAIGAIVDKALSVDYSFHNQLKLFTEPYEAILCGVILFTKKDAEISKIEGIDEIGEIPGFYSEAKVHVGQHIDAFTAFGTITFTAPNLSMMKKYISLINERVRLYDSDGDDVSIKFNSFYKVEKAYKNGIHEFNVR